MKTIRAIFMFACFFGSLLTLYSQSTLYFNGQIFTSDQKTPFIGYFIVKNGIISETGDSLSNQEIMQFTNKVDLQKASVIPGFIDSHIHFIDGSLGLIQISLVDVIDSTELRKKISETLVNRMDGVYVARDLGFSALSGISNPLKFLDRISPTIPIIIFLKSGHAAIVNTAGLKKLSFKAGTKIQDGIIGSDEKGKLNGWLLEEAAMDALKNIGPEYKVHTIENAIIKGQQFALSYGITTIGDNTFSPYNMKIYQALQRDGSLKLRVWTRSYGRIPQTTSLMVPMGIKKLGFIGPKNDFTRVHYHLIKLFEDMSLSVPPGITGNIEPGGTIYLSKQEIKKYLLLHPENTFAFHVQGKQGLQNIIDALDDLGKRNNNRRHVIDHAGYCSEEQLNRLRDFGMSVTILAPQIFDYPGLINEYSNNKVNLTENDLLNTRLKYNTLHGALTSDFPYGMDTTLVRFPNVDGLNPLPNIAVNVTGRFPDGNEIKGFGNKTLTVPDAIRSYTTNGAYVLGEEKSLGKISKGYAADFLVLDHDISESNPMDFYKMQVMQTYIAGEKVYDRKSPTASFKEENPIKPYDYTISPVFGYDPVIGFIYGVAGFIYPLKTPAGYGDLQIMAAPHGSFNIQTNYKRFGLFKNVDFRLPVSATNFIQNYYGETDTTVADHFKEILSNRFYMHPEFSFTFRRKFHTTVFADFMSRKEIGLKDSEGNTIDQVLFPNEQNLGFGLGIIYDTRDNPVSTKLGFYSAVNYENISEIKSSKANSNLLWADLRYFHYLYNSKFVIASRLSGGTISGTPGYMTRYSLGGAERLRGYYTNRFRGNYFYSAQAEFRFPLYKKFSGVCFIDEGDIGDDKLDKILLTYGGGIRFSINENVILRLDYGIAKDQNGLFFTFGEAF